MSRWLVGVKKVKLVAVLMSVVVHYQVVEVCIIRRVLIKLQQRWSYKVIRVGFPQVDQLLKRTSLKMECLPKQADLEVSNYASKIFRPSEQFWPFWSSSPNFKCWRLFLRFRCRFDWGTSVQQQSFWKWFGSGFITFAKRKQHCYIIEQLEPCQQKSSN